MSREEDDHRPFDDLFTEVLTRFQRLRAIAYADGFEAAGSNLILAVNLGSTDQDSGQDREGRAGALLFRA